MFFLLRTISIILIAQVTWGQIGQPGQAPGQVPIDPGYQQPFEPIKNILQGSYANNITLYYRNSPYRVMGDVTVEYGVRMDIETGTRIYFDTGTGLIVKGSIVAVGNQFAHIEMLPYQQQMNYDNDMPRFRLVDGPTVRQGRLQVQFRDRWRSVCTMVTNWTSIDTGTACRSMGYSDGGFWKWYRRNNDTYPFVMPKPDCHFGAKNLWDCPSLADVNKIRLSENLCQGEDDIGIYCWGPPTFTGWARHWKGVQIFDSPFHYVNSDPDLVSVNRESDSRLEFVDILYAGYDGTTKNTTSALFIQGVAPIMNGLRIERSARDGIQLYDTSGPVLIANSTFSFNRGHGIFVDNTTDGRVFINNSRIEGNWGDGIYYRQKFGVNLVTHGIRDKRHVGFGNDDRPRIEMCSQHHISHEHFFPHLISIDLKNRTFLDPTLPKICWMTVSLPSRLPYTYSIQWLNIKNRNISPNSQTTMLICDSINEDENNCEFPRFRVPIHDQIFPQSLSVKSSGKPLYIALEHILDGDQSGYVQGDVNILFKIHASVLDKAYYGLNVTNCIIEKNIGNGIFATDIRERTAISNVTIEENQGHAGFHIRNGAADVWLNETRILSNWGDGVNVSYAGGSIMINGTRIEKNRWRGAAFHFNQTIPFFPLHHEIIFKGRPSNNLFYLPTIIGDNEWGGILIGNYCIPTFRERYEPKILINWVEFRRNQYHPALEIFSCQDQNAPKMIVDITGNRLEGNFGYGLRIAPAVNMLSTISSNKFLNNNDTALYIRNAQWPQLSMLGSNITISKNLFKFNRAKYIVSIGLNDDSPHQSLIFNQQNELRTNTVINPFPDLPPRSTPYAAMVVSSSNVKIHNNCFQNKAKYEIATELEKHAKFIDARENNWGSPFAAQFLDKIFDQFNRYSLASIDINPYMTVCNQRFPHITPQMEVFRQFRKPSEPFQLGGMIYENHDLPKGIYTIVDDLQIVPGAKLTIASGSVMQFSFGVGMIVQGELTRNEYGNDEDVIFTSVPFSIQKRENIRLVDDDGNDQVTEGRLEVLVDDQWGTVCNRSWTADLTILACNQLGLIADVQYFENWRLFPSPGDLPIVMDNIRCEENEVDLTRCRHDGESRNCRAGCRPSEVVGIRCLEPRWAGVRYTLLANPPTVTGQTTMDNWLIEKGGLYNFRTSQFCPAFQIDWNYHTFHRLKVKNNFWDGVDVVYNDLIKKPAFRQSLIYNNRRNGMHFRSAGITVENVTISMNGQSGIRYDPSVSSLHQEDIVSWLSLRAQPELEANNIFHFPNPGLGLIEVVESSLNQRKFLIATVNDDCPMEPAEECVYNLMIRSSGYEYGMTSKMAIQIVNPVSNTSDEDAIFTEVSTGKTWSARKDQVYFPIVSTRDEMRMRYTRSFGSPKLVVLILFLDTQEYLDRFIHVYKSRIDDNQYGFSSVHYSNLTFDDGRIANRWNNEKLWLQKVNFTRNSEAVIWIHSPQHSVLPNTPITEITYHLDNCSVVDNTGPIIESHRDLYSSANVFHWILWSNTFSNNSRSGVSVSLPDTFDLLAKQQHSFWLTENRFENNEDFRVLVDGYYAFVNISSNNFTNNWAPEQFGILELRGMEKSLFFERNRFFNNWGQWMIKIDSSSHYLKMMKVPSFVQFNYIENNHFIKSNNDYVDMWPRSYALGVFGSQRVDVHFNRFKNTLIDFELVSGCKYAEIDDAMNVTHNWWGTGNEAEIQQRIFDFDDWNTMMLAEWSPFYVTNGLFINFWWNPWRDGQLANGTYTEPTVFDLKGRVYQNKNMTLIKERWFQFPHYYRPFRPYRITRDVTIMPGATLTIQAGVEVHIWPNVRILVLGNLIANGTYWDPIRFKPINTTEFDEIRGKIPSEYKRKRRMTAEESFIIPKRSRRVVDRSRPDLIYRQFPTLHRDDPFYQRFTVSLSNNGSDDGRSGFLEIYNSTTGESFASCDRQFTIRNAQVVCRQLGFETMNVYHWLTPRWDYHPKLEIIKTYMEPRECRGDEPSIDRCNLRLSGNTSQWMCMDSRHFNYIYCGRNQSLQKIYIGNWGGIAFAEAKLDRTTEPMNRETSHLLNVEIVGGGSGHNDSWQSAGLQVFHRAPIFDHVNVTNCSMHGVQIISPRDNIVLSHLNVTDNYGQGVNILTTFVQAPTSSQQIMDKPLTIPYHTQGMLEMCSSLKTIFIKNRLLIYYKYDSFPVDCVKVFQSPGKKVAFRLIQFHLYSSPTDLGRSDAIRVYSSQSFSPMNLLAEYRNNGGDSADPSIALSSEVLAIHLRATAADGIYGFIAEISALPSSPESNVVGEVVIRNSRIDRNDRGAIEYSNSGEMSPPLVIEDCSISFNGIHLFGNISTSSQAVQLNLHNTLFLLFRSNSLAHNRGGLLVSATSSSPVARLQGLIKNCLFSYNSNSTTIALTGNNYQVMTILNNVISHNYALYHDILLSHDFAVNMTRNTIFDNIGLHTIDIHANSRISADKNLFFYNHFYDNLALGHGEQYKEKYGYQPLKENNEFLNRPRRQVLTQQGVSFDWWTHVDNETTRYRSTIVAGSAQEIFKFNTFNDPANDYELTTAIQTQYDLGTIDARSNYWGYPGTIGVASGKIRDHEDYPSLVKVDYKPVLESNTSLVEGDCPAGWFQAGHQEFKSCFLFIGASVTYQHAVEYCEQLDAFVPYLRTDDVRQKQLSQRIDDISVGMITDAERIASYGVSNDIHVWISSVNVPSTQCAWLSARTNRIGTVNCNLLLPFVCEKGTHPYTEPILWRAGIIIAIIIGACCVFCIFLLIICWWCKSRKRREAVAERKSIVRASMKLQKKAREHERRNGGGVAPSLRSHESAHASLEPSTISVNEIHNNSWRRGKYTKSPTDTIGTDCTETSDHTYSYTDFKGTKETMSSSTNRSSSKTTSKNLNPYSEISDETDQRASTIRMRMNPIRSETSSDATSCSTCTPDSERTSTATDISSYTESTISTIQNDETIGSNRAANNRPETSLTRPSQPPKSPAYLKRFEATQPRVQRAHQSDFLSKTSNFQPLPTNPRYPPAARHLVELRAPNQFEAASTPVTTTSRYQPKAKKYIIETTM